MQPFHLNKTSRIPYYYQIEEWLRSQIESGVLNPGDPLPSEMSLSQQLGVSRIVVRQALNELTGEGCWCAAAPSAPSSHRLAARCPSCATGCAD